MPKSDPFMYFHCGLKVIRLAVILYVRFPLSFRNVEDLRHEAGYRYQLRNRTLMVEKVRPDFHRL